MDEFVDKNLWMNKMREINVSYHCPHEKIFDEILNVHKRVDYSSKGVPRKEIESIFMIIESRKE